MKREAVSPAPTLFALMLLASAVDAAPPPNATGHEDSIESTFQARDEARDEAREAARGEAKLEPVRNRLDALGLDLALTYDELMLGAWSESESELNGSGDATLNLRWDPWSGSAPDRLIIAARMRHRHAWSDAAPSSLHNEVDSGALWGFTDGFTGRGFEVPELYAQHRFTRLGLVLRYGQMSVDDFFDEHRLRSAKRSFLNQAFSNNPAAGFPGYGIGLVARWRPAEAWDITVGASSMEATNLSDEVNWGFSDALFEGVQVGWNFSGIGGLPARLQLLVWNADGLPEYGLTAGKGLSFTAEQEWSERQMSFLRAAWSDGDAAPVQMLLALGHAWKLQEHDRLGVAVSAGQGAGNSEPWQGVLELFYRRQVKHWLHITPDVQLIAGDEIADGKGWLVVAGLRASLTF